MEGLEEERPADSEMEGVRGEKPVEGQTIEEREREREKRLKRRRRTRKRKTRRRNGTRGRKRSSPSWGRVLWAREWVKWRRKAVLMQPWRWR
jgi:hypothetical protein